MFKKTAVLLLACAAAVLLGSSAGSVLKTSAEVQEKLIRMDLLALKVPDLSESKRNLFLPLSSQTENRGIMGIEELSQTSLRPASEKDQATEAASSFVLRYLGYIRSDERIVALISVSGEVMAVKTGEVISATVEVMEITPEEITVILDDSSWKSFPIEGDQP